MIFVFGSNLAGIHGAGAARHAYEHEGAEWHSGIGHIGNSYAIPTKDRDIITLPLCAIRERVKEFIAYASMHPELKFKVTRIGCGLAGYSNAHIAPMFKDAPMNCFFDREWAAYLPKHHTWHK